MTIELTEQEAKEVAACISLRLTAHRDYLAERHENVRDVPECLDMEVVQGVIVETERLIAFYESILAKFP